MKTRNIIAENEAGVIENLKNEIERCCKQALSKTGAFHVGLSGGSLLNYLNAAIPLLGADCQLEKWKLYFCDERYVAIDDPESTFGCYKEKLLPKTSLKVEQFVVIDLTLPLEQCARDYELKIRKEFGLKNGDEKDIPVFDLLLLGMGPDGHTCSLFPNHALLREQQKLIAHIADSPKPPPQRVTMTLPLINKANCCIFAMCGASKADMVKRIFKDRESLPAALVAPEKGELICIFDKEAGKYIEN